ncbi:AmpG family muropeptide MFS transporter [Trichothermofontia sp.]
MNRTLVNTIVAALKIFESRKMSALLCLGVASGLPLFLTSRTLQAWMKVEGVNLAAIGLFSLVGLPYSLKFFWSPLLDRFSPPFLGRRRGWLAITQVCLLVAIALMTLQRPGQALQLLAINALAIACFSATQDIAADAYRTDVLEPLEMGAGAAVFVLGYRIALLITGSLALILADQLSWPTVYLLMAVLMLLGIVATGWAPEPANPGQPPASLTQAIVLPFQEFCQRLGGLRTLLVLLFIVLFKLGDALVNNMATPFLLEVGFSQTDIGAIQGGIGLVATIVGTLVGGGLLSQLGINRSLWLFGGLQALSNFTYLGLSLLGKNYAFMVLTINIENFCAGLGTAAFVAFLMSLCNHRFSATQYALLSSLMAVSRDILVAPAGWVATQISWPLFFALSVVMALPGLMLLPMFAPWNQLNPIAAMTNISPSKLDDLDD